MSLTSGDVASEDILKDLRNAAESGKQIITEFVKNRLVTMNTDFHNSLTKRTLKTFSSLYSAHAKLDKPKCVKPDRDIFRRIIVSMESGREVNMDELLQKEMCAVCACVYARKVKNRAAPGIVSVGKEKGFIAEHVDVPMQLGAKTQLTMKKLTMKK